MKRVVSALLFWVFFASFWVWPSSELQAKTEFGLSDDALLDVIQKQSLDYFLRETDLKSGMVPDRAHNTRKGATKSASSIAATGLALTVYPIAVERDWMSYGTARALTQRTLHFFLNQAAQERGFFYHFLNMRTGARANNSELSPIDTALFLAGALFAAEYFNDAEIRNLANKIYERIEWDWMLRKNTLALAWSPEEGFHKMNWDHYSELMIMYLLAIGSPTHPIPSSTWDAIRRPVGSYAGHRVIQMPPLFTHQYSHIWIDFRNKHDGHADYFQNSVSAAKANRQFCIDQASKYKTYGPNSWGLTASDGPLGYKAYGAPPGWAVHDGTIAPTGCGGAIVFTPKESIACLRYFYEQLGDKLWGLYGFSDAFNLDKDWVATDVLGLDQGVIIVMIENYRSELVWKKMANNTYLKAAMEKVGFKEGTIELPWPAPNKFEVPYILGGIKPDGYLRDWPNGETIVLDENNRESGILENEKDLMAKVRFAWDEQALYFYIQVLDDDVIVRKTGQNIWIDDLLELFIDPEGDGFYWKNEKDFQIGIRADKDSDDVVSWSWFQEVDPSKTGALIAKGFVDQHGYLIEGMLRWSFIGVKPHAGKTIKVSPAIHDLDLDRQHTKLNWFFRNEEELLRFNLGDLVLVKKEESVA